MRIMVLGVRGLPGVEGGVEKHAELLYPLLTKRGCEVHCLVRRDYVPNEVGHTWDGVQLIRLWAPNPFLPGLEAFVHSFLGVIWAAFKRPDILHIHSIGPALFSLLGRLFGLRIIVTYHTQDFDREKWGLIGRAILRLGEFVAIRSSNACIVISRILQERVNREFKTEAVLIPNGVETAELVPSGNTLRRFSLVPRKYVLMVSRLDPGKRHIDLIRAFAESGITDWKLVLVGSLEPQDRYVRQVCDLAQCTPNVILSGFQSGVALKELYSNAGIFVLPSSHEGLPVALLEALSYGVPSIATDIPANLEVGLPSEHYFPLGDASLLAAKLRHFASMEFSEEWRNRISLRIRQHYDWERISEQTLQVYSRIMGNKLTSI